MASPDSNPAADDGAPAAKRAGRNRVIVIAACVLVPLMALTAVVYHTLPTGHEARFVGRWAGGFVVDIAPPGSAPGAPTHPENFEWWVELRNDGSYVVHQLPSSMRPVAPSGWAPFLTGWWEVRDGVLNLHSHTWRHPLLHRLLRGTTNNTYVIHPVPVRWQGEQLRVYAGESNEFGLNRTDRTWEEFAALTAPP